MKYLDLGHSWALTGSRTTAEATAHIHGSKDVGSNEGNEEEPEESGAGLQLVASLGWVMGAVGEAVACYVGIVAAAVNVELGGEDHSSNEGEEDG